MSGDKLKSNTPIWQKIYNKLSEEKVIDQDEERSAAINYIIKDRHKIAHGKDSDITLARIKDYHNKTIEVITYLKNQCDLMPIWKACH